MSSGMSREREAHERADRALAFHRRTGLCVICRKKPGQPGVTCGDISCIRDWLRGWIPRREIRLVSSHTFKEVSHD